MVRISIILLIIIVIGCQSVQKAPEPSQIIDKERMVEMLTDIAVLKAAKGSYRRVLEEHDVNPEEFILKKYGIDSVTFAENNAWYASQLKEYEKIFNEVKDNLSASKEEYEKRRNTEDSIQRIKDSIETSLGVKKNIPIGIPKDLNEEFIKTESEEAKKKRFSKNSVLKNKKPNS